MNSAGEGETLPFEGTPELPMVIPESVRTEGAPGDVSIIYAAWCQGGRLAGE